MNSSTEEYALETAESVGLFECGFPLETWQLSWLPEDATLVQKPEPILRSKVDQLSGKAGSRPTAAGTLTHCPHRPESDCPGRQLS